MAHPLGAHRPRTPYPSRPGTAFAAHCTSAFRRHVALLPRSLPDAANPAGLVPATRKDRSHTHAHPGRTGGRRGRCSGGEQRWFAPACGGVIEGSNTTLRNDHDGFDRVRFPGCPSPVAGGVREPPTRRQGTDPNRSRVAGMDLALGQLRMEWPGPRFAAVAPSAHPAIDRTAAHPSSNRPTAGPRCHTVEAGAIGAIGVPYHESAGSHGHHGHTSGYNNSHHRGLVAGLDAFHRHVLAGCRGSGAGEPTEPGTGPGTGPAIGRCSGGGTNDPSRDSGRDHPGNPPTAVVREIGRLPECGQHFGCRHETQRPTAPDGRRSPLRRRDGRPIAWTPSGLFPALGGRQRAVGCRTASGRWLPVDRAASWCPSGPRGGLAVQHRRLGMELPAQAASGVHRCPRLDRGWSPCRWGPGTTSLLLTETESGCSGRHV